MHDPVPLGVRVRLKVGQDEREAEDEMLFEGVTLEEGDGSSYRHRRV